MINTFLIFFFIMDFDSYSCTVCNGIFIDVDDYSDHICQPIVDEMKDYSDNVIILPKKKKLKREKEGDVFYWSHNAILGLLAAYQTIQSNKENVKRQRNFWHDLAEELQILGYNVTSDQTRWKMNALIKKI